MSKIKSIVRISGDVGGMNFFEKGGKSFVRNTTSLSKERINSSPEFKRTRENNQEFAGSAKVSKSLKDGFSQVLRTMGDKLLYPRLMAKMRAICSRGAGFRGQRDFSILPNKDLLLGFEFNRKDVLSSVFTAPFSLAVNGSRDTVTITVPDFHTGNQLSAPRGATHFRLINAVVVLSDFQFNTGTAKFEAVDPGLNGLNALDATLEMPLGGMVGGTTSLQAALALPSPIGSDAAVVVCLGIEFFQEINGNYYLLAQGNAMRIVDLV